MLINHVVYFVGWTALLGISLAGLVRPTVPAQLGRTNSKPAKHEPKKLKFWFAVFLSSFFFWMLSGLQVAGVL